ncbi:MAG: protein tyrosine phosphatase family protein [Pseudomonadota bacterium]
MGEPINFVRYSPTFASAGQPDESDLKVLAERGVERVIYIAFSDQERSLAHEDRIVKSLGMEYLHIPVDFAAPRPSEYDAFAAAMRLAPERSTLLHCQVNFRATAFSLLYRVLELGVPLAEAKADMNRIWTPNDVWTAFIRSVLESRGVDPDCEGCDWTPAT